MTSSPLAREAHQTAVSKFLTCPILMMHHSLSRNFDLTIVLGRWEVTDKVWVGTSWDQDPCCRMSKPALLCVRSSMSDMPCLASGHGKHLHVCLSFSVKRGLSLLLHTL